MTLCSQERTEALVKQLLRVSMVNNTLEAEILAKAQCPCVEVVVKYCQ